MVDRPRSRGHPEPKLNDLTHPSAADCRARRLQREAWSLIRAGRGDDAIVVAEGLMELFASETGNDAHVALGDTLAAAASAVAFTDRAGLNRIQQTLRRLRLIVVGVCGPVAGYRSSNPAVAQQRWRLQQALRIDDVLIARLGGLPDPASHRTVVQVSINRAVSLFLLGNTVQSIRALAEMIGRDHPAYGDIAARPGPPYLEKTVAAILLKAARPHN